jgi:hypothetical protein
VDGNSTEGSGVSESDVTPSSCEDDCDRPTDPVTSDLDTDCAHCARPFVQVIADGRAALDRFAAEGDVSALRRALLRLLADLEEET